MTHPCYVYFVQAGDGGNIKIGISRNVRGRLSKMQTDAGVHLTLMGLCEGDETLEQSLHRELEKFRVTGEWFSPAPEVMSAARRVITITGLPSLALVSKRQIPKSPFHAWRIRSGLTGAQAAALLGIERTHISHLENGQRFPSWPLLETIYRVTDGQITPNDFAKFMHEMADEVAA
jgi:DNA-binding XRE family transcriptional regulator